MTITARHARRQIEATCTLLANITPRIAQGIHNAHVALDGGGDNQHREDAGIRGKGWISDPTAQQALGRIATHERILDDIETALDTMRLTVQLMVTWVELHAPVEIPEQRRCGEFTPRDIKLEEWYTTANRLGRVPVSCQSGAWYDTLDGGKISWRSHGLCSSCYSLRRDWLRRQESDVA